MWCLHIQYCYLSHLYGNTAFCSDTTPPTTDGTETTTPGNPSTPTSEGIVTTSNSTTGWFCM